MRRESCSPVDGAVGGRVHTFEDASSPVVQCDRQCEVTSVLCKQCGVRAGAQLPTALPRAHDPRHDATMSLASPRPPCQPPRGACQAPSWPPAQPTPHCEPKSESVCVSRPE
jgi:hypothetical protein